MKPYTNDLITRLFAVIKTLGLTQEAAAESIGIVHRQDLNRWARGEAEPRYETGAMMEKWIQKNLLRIMRNQRMRRIYESHLEIIKQQKR